MKIIKKYGLYIPKKAYKLWRDNNPKEHIFKLIDNLICITEHGTICRKGLKSYLEEENKRKKNKDYSSGLSITGPKYIPKKIKKMIRRKKLNKLKKIIDEGKATLKEKNAYKKLRILLRKGV